MNQPVTRQLWLPRSEWNGRIVTRFTFPAPPALLAGLARCRWTSRPSLPALLSDTCWLTFFLTLLLGISLLFILNSLRLQFLLPTPLQTFRALSPGLGLWQGKSSGTCTSCVLWVRSRMRVWSPWRGGPREVFRWTANPAQKEAAGCLEPGWPLSRSETGHRHPHAPLPNGYR